MTKEALDSNRINYLIWRYLQESNYPDTALKLQKEWDIDNPQELAFAQHVQQNTLVKLLHKGLLYHESERSNPRKCGDVTIPLRGAFGPVAPSTPAPPVDEEDSEKVRKRQLEQRSYQTVRNGSPAKRARLSNGYENGIPTEATPMEIDETANGNGHAYPSPKEVERPPTPIIKTDGPEKGTQVEKVTELGSETTFLTLSEHPGANKPIVLHCEWSPQDPTILAAAGTDALARMWSISRGPATADVANHVNGVEQPQSMELADEHVVKSNSTISAIAWTSNGEAIAVASDSPELEDEQARVIIWTKDGHLFQQYQGYEPPIVCLRWNPNNSLLLVLMPHEDTTQITILSPSTQGSAEYRFPQPLSNLVYFDVAWTDNFEFVLCGGDVLQSFSCKDAVITPGRKYDTRPDHKLNKVLFDPRSRLLATSSLTGNIDVWNEFGNSHSISAHRGTITSLLWQPLSVNAPFDDNSDRLLVSSGEDGIISIWNARAEGKAKASMTMDSSVLAMAFTPDGAFLAGATSSQILIWRTDDVSVPRARWVQDQEPGWQSPKSTGSSSEAEEYLHCLAWDADGQKLAFGVNNQLAVIKWQPLNEIAGQ